MSRNEWKDGKPEPSTEGEGVAEVAADEKSAESSAPKVKEAAPSKGKERPALETDAANQTSDEREVILDEEDGEAVGWSIQLTRGRVVDVTERHVVLSDDSLGFITFDDGEALSIEGIRRIGW